MAASVRDQVRQLDAASRHEVRDQVRQLDAASRRSRLSPNLGDQIRNAPTHAPKPAPSLGRQNGEDPSQVRGPVDVSLKVPAGGQASRLSPRPVSPRPASPRPVSPRPAAPRPVSPRPAAPRPVSPRPAAPRPVSPRPVSPRPSSPRPERAVVVSGGSLEEEVTNWIEVVAGERKGGQSQQQWLKDGQVLCRLANMIQPGICPRITTQSQPFKQMENVTAFIQACRTLGVLEKDVFSTVDLYEGKNMKSVNQCIASLGGCVRNTAPSFRGPYIGVAQNAAVSDTARSKAPVTQDSGFRSDINKEVKAGVSWGRRM